MGSYAKLMGGQELLPFLSGGSRRKLFAQCIFGCDFLSPRSTNGYWKLSQCLHVLFLWWFGTVVTALRSLKSEIREYISLRINFRLYSTLAEKWAGQHWITKISSDHETFITKIYFNPNLERFTKFLNHENLELYSMFSAMWLADGKFSPESNQC